MLTTLVFALPMLTALAAAPSPFEKDCFEGRGALPEALGNLTAADLLANIQERKIRTPTEWVERLSESAPWDSFLTRNTLIYASRSPERAAASKEAPRTIFFGKGLVLAATHHPAPENRHTNRLMQGFQFDFVRDAWVPFVIDFNAEPPTLNPNPSACIGCHGDPPRPHWPAYAVWPGAYGGRGFPEVAERDVPPAERAAARAELPELVKKGLVPADLEKRIEDQSRQELLEIARNRGIDGVPDGRDPAETRKWFAEALPELLKVSFLSDYELETAREAAVKAIADQIWDQSVRGPNPAPLGRYAYRMVTLAHAKQTTLPPLAAPYAKLAGLEGNVEMTFYLQALNLRRIARELTQSRDFARYRFATLGALLECPDLPSFVAGPKPKRSYAELLADTKKVVAGRIEQLRKQVKEIGTGGDPHTFSQERDIERVTGLRYLFEGRGVDVGKFSLDYSPGRSTVGYGFAGVNTPYAGLHRLACFFVPGLAREDADFTFLLDWEPGRDPKDSEAKRKRACRLLKQKSLAAFRAPSVESEVAPAPRARDSH